MAVLATRVPPGPDIAPPVGRGVGRSRRVAPWTAVGMTVGAGAVQLPLLAHGVASLVQSAPPAYAVPRWLGAGSLARLGARLPRTAGHPAVATPAVGRTSARAAAREGMISNPTDPEVAASMPGVMPRFVDPAHGPVHRPVAAQPLVLGAVRKIRGLCAPGTVAPVSGTLGGRLARRPGPIAWRGRSTGAVMVALGPRLPLAGDARAARGWPERSGRRVGGAVIGGP